MSRRNRPSKSQREMTKAERDHAQDELRRAMLDQQRRDALHQKAHRRDQAYGAKITDQ